MHRLYGALVVGLVLLTASTDVAIAKPADYVAECSKPMVIAHRGGRKWAPENTMAGFKKSLENNIDAIELDIHRCKSGELVVIHDETLDRTTSGNGFVKDKTWDELKLLSAAKGQSPEFASEGIPLLKDVLTLIDGKLVLNIEIKNAPIRYPGLEDDLLSLLKSYKYPDKIIISSFDHGIIAAIAKKSTRYKLALLGDSLIYRLGNYAASAGATAWHPYFGELRKDAVDEAKASRLMVNVWTVNERPAWRTACDMGVDGICTDDPLGLKLYLQSDRSVVR